MNDCIHHTDEQLFSLMAENDEQAFRIFFYRYNVKVYYFTLRIIKCESRAEELTQDVFLKLWLGRSMLASVTRPGNYLFVVAKNHALDQLEKLASHSALQHTFRMQQPKESNNSEEQMSFRDSREMVASAVHLLPRQQQIVYHLSKEQGLSRSQIATLLHLSPHTVKNHLGVALQSIRQYLSEMEK